MKIIPLCFLLLFIDTCLGVAEIADLVKIDLAKYPNARCLDGSPGAFYIFQNVTQKQKWYIYHQGGGWCAMDVPSSQGRTVDNCWSRSSTFLGSSTPYAAKLALGDPNVDVHVAGCPAPEYISGDPKVNPLMYNWTKVQIQYCDGGSFSGRNETVASKDGSQLHLKGNFILEAVIDTLKTQYGMADALEVVVGGGSAGGLATYLHIEQWRASLPASTFVVGLADGGFFLDWHDSKPGGVAHSYASELRSDFWDFNASSGVNQDCVRAYMAAGGDIAECFFAEHTVSFIKTPFFILQSVVDDWQLGNELGDYSPAPVNAYRLAATSRLLGPASRSNLGGFIDSCKHHCGYWAQIVINGTLMSDAFSIWYGEQLAAWRQVEVATSKRWWWQAKEYPCSACCGAQSFSTPQERNWYSMKINGAFTAESNIVV